MNLFSLSFLQGVENKAVLSFTPYLTVHALLVQFLPATQQRLDRGHLSIKVCIQVDHKTGQ